MYIGISITTAIRAEIAYRCIRSVIDHTPQPRYIVVLDNDSQESAIREIPNVFEEVHYVRMPPSSTLTQCWNEGYYRCYWEGCDVLIQMNDDVIVNETWPHVALTTKHCEETIAMFGPVTDRPGIDYSKRQLVPDLSTCPSEPTATLAPDAQWNCLNGFCFSINRKTYRDVVQ